MKNIKNLTAAGLLATTTNQQTGGRSYSDESKKVINDAFKRMQGMRPAWRIGFKSAAEIDNYKTEMLAGCVARGVDSDIMIEVGLLEMLKETGDKSAYLPDVGKFLNWCKPPQHHEHRAQEKVAALPPMRWLTDDNKKARIQAVKDEAIAKLRTPSKPLTKEEQLALLEKLKR